MSRISILKVSLATCLSLAASFGLMSCKPALTAADVAAALTYSDSPTWANSSWTGTEIDLTASYPYIEKVVTTSSGSTTTIVPLMDVAYSLALGGSGSFTFTSSGSFDPNWTNNYVSEPFQYSTNPASYSPPLPVSSETDYKYNGYTAMRINGQLYYAYLYTSDGISWSWITSLPDSSLYTISGTSSPEASAKFGVTVYPVTFAASTVAPAMSGKIYNLSTVTGTFTTTAVSSDPSNGSTIPILAATSRTIVTTAYDPTKGLVSSTTSATTEITPNTDPFNSAFTYNNGKLPNASGAMVYTILYNPNYNSGALSDRVKSLAKGISKDLGPGGTVILFQQ
jgi:hypothetical protein